MFAIMKELKLTQYHRVTASQGKAKYLVDLGGKIRYEFNQEKEALTFLSKSSRELNNHVRTINDLYIQVAQVVQSYYFDYTGNAVIELNYTIASINKMLHQAFSMQNRHNDYYFKRTMAFANSIAELILFVFRNANKMHYTNIEYRLDSIQLQIDAVLYSLRKRGKYQKSSSLNTIQWDIEILPFKVAS